MSSRVYFDAIHDSTLAEVKYEEFLRVWFECPYFMNSVLRLDSQDPTYTNGCISGPNSRHDKKYHNSSKFQSIQMPTPSGRWVTIQCPGRVTISMNWTFGPNSAAPNGCRGTKKSQ